jgi:hypothetical protein
MADERDSIEENAVLDDLQRANKAMVRRKPTDFPGRHWKDHAANTSSPQKGAQHLTDIKQPVGRGGEGSDDANEGQGD